MDRWLITATHKPTGTELELVPVKTQDKADTLLAKFSASFSQDWEVKAIEINTALDDETVTADEQP